MGFASLAFTFFRADHFTALLRSALTIGLIVERLGDDDSRGQHDHNNRADDCVVHIPTSPVPCPIVADNYPARLAHGASPGSTSAN